MSSNAENDGATTGTGPSSNAKINGFIEQLVATRAGKTAAKNAMSRFNDKANMVLEPHDNLEGALADPAVRAGIMASARYWLGGEEGRVGPRLPKRWIAEGAQMLTNKALELFGAECDPDAVQNSPDAFVQPLPVDPDPPSTDNGQSVLCDLFGDPAPVATTAPDPDHAETLPAKVEISDALAPVDETLPLPGASPVEEYVPPEEVVIGKIGRADIIQWVDGLEPRLGCFYAGMPNEVYHALPHASNSRLSRIAKSPAHARYEPPRVQSAAMRIGSAIHASILEPHMFDEEWVLLPDVKDRRQSEYKEAVKVHGAEKILVADEVHRVAAAQATLYSDPHAAPLLEADGWTELSALSQCPDTGAMLRFRFDKITSNLVGVDLKKTRDAGDDEFSRSIAKYRYHVQAALYSDQFFYLTGERLAAWVFLAVEDEPPHAVRLYVLDDEAMDLGRRLYQRDLALWAECERTGDWSLPDSKATVLGLPAWSIKQTKEELGLNVEAINDPNQTQANHG